MKKNQIITILSIYGALSLLLVVFLIYPLFNEIIKNSQDLISEKNNIITLETQVKEIENFKENYETYKKDLEKIDNLFIDPDNPVNFIEFLESAASNSGVSLKISSVPTYTESQKVTQNFITLQFASTGDFSKILGFIKKIEEGPYLIEITNLTIGNPKETEGGAQIAPPAKTTKPAKVTPEVYLNRKVDASFSIKVFTKL